MKRKRIVVLAGGWSREREVSLASGKAVYGALDRDRYEALLYDPGEHLETLVRSRSGIDLVLIMLHGRFGEDGRIQGFLDLLGIPFSGSGVLASAMAMNKRVTKEVYVSAGLKVAAHVALKRGNRVPADGILKQLGQTVIVKPVTEGSSFGISVCRSVDELERAVETAFRHDEEVLAEEFLSGKEITCCVLGNRALETLPLVEIVPGEAHPFFDHAAKYTPGATREICPARVSRKLAERAASCARKAHRALGCRVWSRTDMILRDDRIYLLETNTVPGMTPNSLFPLAAGAAGWSLSDLVDRLIDLSLER